MPVSIESMLMGKLEFLDIRECEDCRLSQEYCHSITYLHPRFTLLCDMQTQEEDNDGDLDLDEFALAAITEFMSLEEDGADSARKRSRVDTTEDNETENF
jgi:hypothetical protein